MGTLWIPGAEKLSCSAPGGTITSDAPPRVVWHTTEADPGTSTVWTSMIRVLNNKGAEPQVLYDPLTDRLGQFMPLNVSGRALRNDGTTRTNRVGKVCIQIEVIGRSAKPFTGYWKPGPNFRALMAAIRSWAIPDLWPAGIPPRFVQVGTGGYNTPENDRDRSTWLTKGGHFSHSQIPGNNHGDPGGISVPALFAAAPKPAPTTTASTGGSMAIQDTTEYKAAYQANADYNRALWGEGGTAGEFMQRTDARILDIVGRLEDIKNRLIRIEADTDKAATIPTISGTTAEPKPA